MKRCTIIIVDDEKLARDSIRVLLKDNSQWHIIAEAANGGDAIKKVDNLKPDLIFLDINMPQLSGMEVLRRLSYRPYVIFTTAYDSFAVKAFEENAVDYLLKPYTDKRFIEALDRATLKINGRESAQKLESIMEMLHEQERSPSDSSRKIAIRNVDKIILLDVADIIWIRAAGNYVEIFTADQKYLHYESMQKMEGFLNEQDFLRIHRSYIIRQSQIKSLRKHTNGEFYVTLLNEKELKVSRSYGDQVKQIIAGMS